MLKIGEFSKLSCLTVKTLRYYEKEGLLMPAEVDKWTGYRYYTTEQLATAAKIKAFRQLDLSIEEIKGIFDGGDLKSILMKKSVSLQKQQADIRHRLSGINHILEDEFMNYQVTVKTVSAAIVYYSEATLDKYADAMQFISMCGKACKALNPDLKCTVPSYEFCEYPDGEYKESNVRIRHNEAVEAFGKENDLIKFRRIPETKVLSIYHKGAYENIGEAYAYIMQYAEQNGYRVVGLARECYIDGIWNKEDAADWLTEIQLPIE